jgi:hypothetical protein
MHHRKPLIFGSHHLAIYTRLLFTMVSCLAVHPSSSPLTPRTNACMSTETETTNSPVFIDLPSAPHCLLINHKLSTIFLPLRILLYPSIYMNNTSDQPDVPPLVLHQDTPRLHSHEPASSLHSTVLASEHM